MSVNAKLTAIADKIRSLLGITDTMGLDAMATNLTNINDEVESQNNLIDQIISVLEGKAMNSTSNNTSNIGIVINGGYEVYIDAFTDAERSICGDGENDISTSININTGNLFYIVVDNFEIDYTTEVVTQGVDLICATPLSGSNTYPHHQYSGWVLLIFKDRITNTNTNKYVYFSGQGGGGK
jgi:hypothetical protein